MALLDGAIPYALATGNHDYSICDEASLRVTPLNSWFSFADTAALQSFGGAYESEKLDNTYHLFEAGGHSWIAVVLEWGPRDEVIAWANEVMEHHPDRLGILVTHAYLNMNSRRFDQNDDHEQYNPHNGVIPDVNDGEELWQGLVRRHRFVLTLNGHALGDGTGYLANTTDRGNTVHQLLTNFQTRSLGGEGYLSLLELLPNGRTIRVHSYSPFLDRFLMDPDHRFTIQLDAS
jgi:hypothetical protein